MSAAEYKAKGDNHLKAKEFDLAIEAYSKAIELNPSDHVFYSNRSAAYLSKGDAQHAFEDGQKCIEVNPSFAKGYSRKGAALHSLKRYKEAMDAYEAGLKIAPDDSGLKSGLAEVKKAQQSSSSSGGFLSPQLLSKLATHPKFGPKLADPTFMAKLQMLQTNPQLLMQDPEIMELFSALVGDMKGAAGDDDYVPPTPPPSTSTSYNNDKKSKPAPKDVEPEEDLSKLSPEELAAREKKKASLAAKERGTAFYKSKQFPEALAAYDEALSHDPNNILLMNNKAAVYIEMGELDTAINECNKAIEIGRAHRAPYEEIAKVYQRIAAAQLKRGEIKGAIETYGKSQMEFYDKAIERKIKNLELDLKNKEREEYINPEKGAEAKERGNTAFRENNYPLAISEYEEAIKRDPTNAAYRNNLAAALLKVGDFNGAKAQVEKSLELDKKYVKAWAKKGDIEFFMKEYHKAMESYKTGLAIEPENSLCKQGLQKTIQQINAGQFEGPDKERAAHAMADPEIQSILMDPMIRQILSDFQENPQHAQRALQDPHVRAKIDKLIAAGVLQVK